VDDAINTLQMLLLQLKISNAMVSMIAAEKKYEGILLDDGYTQIQTTEW